MYICAFGRVDAKKRGKCVVGPSPIVSRCLLRTYVVEAPIYKPGGATCTYGHTTARRPASGRRADGNTLKMAWRLRNSLLSEACEYFKLSLFENDGKCCAKRSQVVLFLFYSEKRNAMVEHDNIFPRPQRARKFPTVREIQPLVPRSLISHKFWSAWKSLFCSLSDIIKVIDLFHKYPILPDPHPGQSSTF